MKKLITLLIVLVFSGSVFTANAASYTTSKGSVVSVDPVDLINSRLNATFEKKMAAKNSFTVNLSYWMYASDATAMGLGASYRWYIDLFEEGKSSLNGLSIGPRLDFYYWSWDLGVNGDDSYSTLALGAEVNYKWVFSDKWSVEPTIKFAIPVVEGSGRGYTNYGFGINLGYAF